MLNRNKIRVGIVGANPSRGFASIAHIPALQALPDFEISAVCTTRKDSADAAAKHFGVPLAFSDAEKLARDPAVDRVGISTNLQRWVRPRKSVRTGLPAGGGSQVRTRLGRPDRLRPLKAGFIAGLMNS